MTIGFLHKERTIPTMLKNILVVSIFILVVAFALAGCGGEEAVTFLTIDVGTLHDRWSTEENAQVLDVREPSEWATTGVVPGSTLIPLADVARRAPEELDKSSPVYVICNSGNRSRTASETLIGLGFLSVYNIDGGIQAWLSAGLPVEPYVP